MRISLRSLFGIAGQENFEGDGETCSACILGTKTTPPNGAEAMAFNKTLGPGIWGVIETLPAETQGAIIGGGGLGFDRPRHDSYTFFSVLAGPDAPAHQAEILAAFEQNPEVLGGYGLRVIIRDMLPSVAP